jgi:hypothetical protein
MTPTTTTFASLAAETVWRSGSWPHMMLIATQKVFAATENARSHSKEFAVTDQVLQLPGTALGNL